MITIMIAVWILLAIACVFSFAMVIYVSVDPACKMQRDLEEWYRLRPPYKLPVITHRVTRTEQPTIKGKGIA